MDQGTIPTLQILGWMEDSKESLHISLTPHSFKMWVAYLWNFPFWIFLDHSWLENWTTKLWLGRNIYKHSQHIPSSSRVFPTLPHHQTETAIGCRRGNQRCGSIPKPSEHWVQAVSVCFAHVGVSLWPGSCMKWLIFQKMVSDATAILGSCWEGEPSGPLNEHCATEPELTIWLGSFVIFDQQLRALPSRSAM